MARTIAGAAILVVTSCAGHDDEQVTATTTAALDPAPVTLNVPTYVTLESPHGSCQNNNPLACFGGSWVREVNRVDGLRLVSRFDVSALAPLALAQATGAGKGELLLRGVFEARERKAPGAPFFVTEAWRGLPDAQPAPLDRYFATQTINAGQFAELLNDKWVGQFATLSVTDLAPLRVDTDWLMSRVLDHGATVAGRLHGATLEATQVFLRLPDVAGPCPEFRIRCSGGEVATFDRSVDRCLIPTGCVVPGICPLWIPRCEPGYDLVSWVTQPTGCPAFECDPSFLGQ